MDLAIEFVKRNRPREPQLRRRRTRAAKPEAANTAEQTPETV